MLPSVADRLGRLPLQLLPLEKAVRRHYARGASVQPDGTVQVAPMPWVGPEAFALVLYPPAQPAWMATFAERNGGAVPEGYAPVLAAVNGCFAFGLALFGLPPSLHGHAPLPGRHPLEPLDLEAANRYWSREYLHSAGEFHFGGCTWTATENVGYFLTVDGQFRSRRKDGEVLQEWASIRDLLEEELPAAEERARERRPVPPVPWAQGRTDPTPPPADT